MRFRISVRTLQDVVLTFFVSDYKITEGDFVEFIDEKNGIPKRFHASNCEIEQIQEEKNP